MQYTCLINEGGKTLIELNKIYNEDCLEGMKRIPDGSVDMILCDLPYGTTANKWDSIIDLKLLWGQYNRVIKEGGVIVLTASQPFTTTLINSNIGNFRYEWVWEKEQGTGFLTANKMPLKNHENVLIFYEDLAKVKGRSKKLDDLRGYMKSERDKTGLTNKGISQLLGNQMGGHYFTDGVQFTLPTRANYEKLQETGHFKVEYRELKKTLDTISKKMAVTYNPQMRNGFKPYKTKQGGPSENYGNKMTDITTESDGMRYPLTVLKVNRDQEKAHPTQKPVALFDYLIRTYTNEGDTVLDNCMGSGTTAVACMNTNRNYIGFELDETYFNLANERIEMHAKEE